MSDSECIVSGYLSYLNKYIKQEITQSLHYHSMTVFRATTSEAVTTLDVEHKRQQTRASPIILLISFLLFFYYIYSFTTHISASPLRTRVRHYLRIRLRYLVSHTGASPILSQFLGQPIYYKG